MTNFFFYGIFKRHGVAEHMLLRDCTYLGSATAPGFVILDHNGPAAMVPGSTWRGTNNVAKGDIVAVPDEHFEAILKRLDRVESNGNAYIRVKIEAIMDDGERVEAYTYLWIEHYREGEVLEDGNWSRPFKIGVDI